jgi:N-acetylmuramic acid 6-phosphate etherase
MTMDFSHLLTEQQRPELSDLDLLSTADLVSLMSADQREALEAVRTAEADITRAIDAVVVQLERGGRLVYAGAGTAGRMGLLDAAECPPTFNTDRVVGVIAGGPDALLVSKEAVEDDAEAGAAAIDDLEVGSQDAVVGLSASGRTPYTVGAVNRARERGAVTIGVTCNPGSELSEHVDHAIEVVVGPEVIAGSTRLKGGTAQKVVLNMISTIVMVRIGKTFGNLMVDLKATNEKLRDRARRIVMQATAAEPEDADRALAISDGEVKVAIIMLLTGCDADAARRNLQSHQGRVRNALEERG